MSDYTKMVFNISTDRFAVLKAASGATGITMRQIIEDALALHQGHTDPMMLLRQDMVKQAINNLTSRGRHPGDGSPGTFTSDTPKASKKPKRATK